VVRAAQSPYATMPLGARTRSTTTCADFELRSSITRPPGKAEMEPLSIATGCICLITTISKTSSLITSFVRNCRAARHDLDDISRELASVENVLNLLRDDTADTNDESIPETLRVQIATNILNCGRVLRELDELLRRYNGERIDQAASWVMTGRYEAAKLRSSLAVHRENLNFALEMLTLYVHLRDHCFNLYLTPTTGPQFEGSVASRTRSRTTPLRSSMILSRFSATYVLSSQLKIGRPKTLEVVC